MYNKTIFIMVGIILAINVFYINQISNIQSKKSSNTKIKVSKNNKVLDLDLENYIIGVVAGEMPASFNMEALKAQAVASRSYALKQNNKNKILKADTSSQVYISIDEMKEKWKDDFNYYYKRVKNAVIETKGEVLTKENEIITAYYFAMSNGHTQDGKYVFEEKPYLKEVESVYENESLNNFKVNFTLSIQEFKQKLGITCENIVLNYIHYNNSNYVSELSICNKTFKGNEFRHLLGLRSPSFKVSISGKIDITTYGYGHGVGMSQYGANGYAQNGYTYKDILYHYYKSTKIKRLNV